MFPPGSSISEGNIFIILAIAAVAVFAVIFIAKKKKTADTRKDEDKTK